MLAIVAHDLRSPLNSIYMATTLLERKLAYAVGRAGIRPLEAIKRASDRAKRLIEDLLMVTRMEAGQLTVERRRLSCDRLVREVVEAHVLMAASSQIDLRIELDPDLPDVFADRDRLLQVLENLLGNALKFTPQGGQIVVCAQAAEREVRFCVRNTGAGLRADELPHVFDRFWQANRRERRGAGLGLTICKGIIEAHGGRIWVDSDEHGLTTFHFTIPRATQASSGAVEWHAPPPA
jgi:signal transduction histidine kinase